MIRNWLRRFKRLRSILIVEDLPIWQKNFRRILRDEPFNVHIASNTAEALGHLNAHPIDVVLLDINLSGVSYNIDGLRLAEQIWKDYKNIRIIIVSGSQEWDKRLSNYHFIPSFVIEKQNLDVDDLIEKIHRALNTGARQRATT